jgi:uncharacterized protein YjdB
MKLKSILTAFAALALVTCAPEPVRVSQITLNTKALTLNVGASEKLTASVSPYNADNPTIIWSSDNASIAKVSNGTVTAVAPGTAKITAKADDGGISDACVVTVIMPVTGVTLDRTAVSMYEGGTDQLVATVTPDNANNPSLLWTSSNPDVVLVTTDGKLFALAPGKADITVTTVDGGFSNTCKVTVQEVKMELKPPTLDILVGDESDIQVTLENQLEGVSVNIRWYSTDESIVTVDQKGHVKAIALGDAVICASTEKGKTAFCKVHVRSRIASVTVTAPGGAKDVSIGSTLQLTAEVAPSDLPGVDISWKSSDTSIATVSADGLVTAKSKGTVTITVTVKNGPETKTATYELTVLKPVTKVTVTPATLELFVGDEIEIDKQFKIVVEPTDADYAGFKYSSSEPGIISFSQGGKFVGAKAGSVTLFITPNKANPDNQKAEVKITVKAKVEGITIQGSETKTVQVKKTLQLKASVTPSNANQEVVWSSSKTGVAKVDANGLVTGVKAGTAVITATSKEDSAIKATCKVTVENIPVTSVELDKTSLSLVEGDTYTLKATVKPDDAAEKTPAWTSSDPEVATVSDAGVVTAVKAGTAIITAKCGEKTATCAVTVESKYVNVTGVTLDKETLTLDVNRSAQLTATVLPANANNKDVKWSTSSSAVTVMSQGNVATVTGRSAGEAIVTVKTVDGEFTKECKVTVIVPVTSITLSQTSATIAYGQTLSLTANVLPTNASDPTLEWSSDKPTVASVSDGVVTAGSSSGTATITAKSKSNPSVTATCKVTVKSQIILVNKITITPSRLDLALNETAKVTATVSPSNADNTTIIWTVPQGSVASVDQDGNVTAVREGTSSIIAKSADGNAQAWITVKVTKVAVTDLILSPTALTLKVGETYDLKATIEPYNASVKKVSWSSSNSSCVTVDANGRVTAKAATGDTPVTITAKPTDATSLKKTCTVTVLGSGTGTGGAEGIDFEDWNF